MSSFEASSEIAEIADELLSQVGLGSPVEIVPLAGGRNNRTYRLRTQSGSFLLKHYFQDASGVRDRRAAEWNWSTFCWHEGITWVPQPLATVADSHSSLFEFVEGRPLSRQEIRDEHVEQAARFVSEVNQHCADPFATSMESAAEACFSFEQHLDCVQKRIERLLQLPANDEVELRLNDWLQQSLVPSWHLIMSQLQQRYADRLSDLLAASDRCLSPSDFGFHNAIMTSNGRLRFIDFEYAGWDDPAKLVCDFYLQPQRPAPQRTRSSLIAALASRETEAELTRRIDALTPVYGIKWCCLMLNEFVTADRQRREFASAAAIGNPVRENQLRQAQGLLEATCTRYGLDAKSQ